MVFDPTDTPPYLSRKSGDGFKSSLIFIPEVEDMIQFDGHNFQMGW